jgi:hypothetical protein
MIAVIVVLFLLAGVGIYVFTSSTKLETASSPYYALPGTSWARDTDYPCPDTEAGKKGGGKWCMFDSEKEAQAGCDSDPSCMGYVHKPPHGRWQLTKMISLPHAGGGIYMKKRA